MGGKAMRAGSAERRRRVHLVEQLHVAEYVWRAVRQSGIDPRKARELAVHGVDPDVLDLAARWLDSDKEI